MWQRKHRQYQEDRCNVHNELNNYQREEGNEFECWDNGWDDDLRETFCLNKNNMSVLEALKSDLECTWNAGVSLNLSKVLLLTFLVSWMAIAY